MLRTVNLNDNPRFGAEEIDFYPAPAVEGDWQVGIHLKPSARFWQGLQTPIKKRL